MGSLPEILIVTGVMASGKSTVAQAIAERLPRSVHVKGDVFRRMIVGGRAEPEPDNMASAESQLALRYEIAATVAARYAQAGYSVILQDVILGQHLARVAESLSQLDCGLVVLNPAASEIEIREQNRTKKAYRGWTPGQLVAALNSETPRLGLWLDTTNMSVEETVNAIFARADETRLKAR
jgi:predicted kinase